MVKSKDFTMDFKNLEAHALPAIIHQPAMWFHAYHLEEEAKRSI